jgi:hypothetical protein
MFFLVLSARASLLRSPRTSYSNKIILITASETAHFSSDCYFVQFLSSRVSVDPEWQLGKECEREDVPFRCSATFFSM